MSSNWKILAAIDFSHSTEADLEYADSLATALRADLHLRHFTEGDRRQAGSHCASAKRVTAASIVEHADEMNAALVLMISRRYGRWNRFWGESVIEEVMRLSSHPVWIVPATNCDREFRCRSRRFLCAVGLDNRDTGLLRHAHDTAVRASADLALVHVVPQPSEALLYEAVEGSCRPLSISHAEKNLTRVARDLPRLASTSVIAGEASKRIASAANEQSVDLVFASRPQGGIQSVYGADLEHVLANLQSPLVTVPVDVRVSVPMIPESLESVRAPGDQPALRSVAAAFQRLSQNALYCLQQRKEHARTASRSTKSALSRST
jgi:nucleotide-binding universal stress UspA family protein